MTERWRGYPWYPPWRRQLCWALLLRDLEAMITRGGRSAEIGEALRAQARFRTYRQPSRREVERRLEVGQTGGVPKTEGTCRGILQLRQALWTCVRHEGEEPTHNAAERAIRPGVLWRKGSFGTHRPEGARFVGAMLTVVAPLRQQHRSVLDYLTAACAATLRGAPAPSLLPTPAESQPLLPPAA